MGAILKVSDSSWDVDWWGLRSHQPLSEPNSLMPTVCNTSYRRLYLYNIQNNHCHQNKIALRVCERLRVNTESRKCSNQMVKSQSAPSVPSTLAHVDGKHRYNILTASERTPLSTHGNETKKHFVHGAALLPKTIRRGSSTCPHTFWLVQSCFFYLQDRACLGSALSNMINAPTGLTQDGAEWLALIKRLQL